MADNKFYSNGKATVAYSSDYSVPMYRSGDGVNYFEMLKTGFGGTTLNHTGSFLDPFDNDKSYKFSFDESEQVIRIDEQLFVRIPKPGIVNLVGLPDTRKPEYLFRTLDNRLLYVSAAKYKYTYESFRLFIQEGGKMRRLPILKVTRLRDGGTTLIKTPEGDLFSPTVWSTDLFPTWREERITTLKSEDFTIEESSEEVIISEIIL